MKEKKRKGSTRLTDRIGAPKPHQLQKHHNRLKKQKQAEFIKQHRSYHFYLDLKGNVFYEVE